MSSFEHVRFDPPAGGYIHITSQVTDKIAVITLNRPKSVNVQSTAMLEELDHAIDAAMGDREVNVVVLCGAGKHFSAGHDIGSDEEMAHRENFPLEEGVRGQFNRQWRLYLDNHLRWRNAPKPMICAIHGYVIYGGWQMASVCDVIFAAEDTMLLGSAFQYFSIPYDIHPRKAKEILFQSRFISAAEACDLGFVNRVVPNDQLMDEVMAYARDVAANDPFDMRMTKLAINNAQDAQGFSAHIQASNATYITRRTAQMDPDYAIPRPMDTGVKRMPMVEVAMERFRRMNPDKA
ncbi:enoyl-CoA hydratase-related protein [Pseudooceanicola sp.]|uniref:enoyl-CoA hydratase-related protein n=1 Tax=Pseudooceanicola sp. TaxID=1914328 RepID=UPI00262D2B41|nr:enoyl-CoA hydratase-related protein [Pseudooceanicola sp.]MDF1855897.1 enoyl-CoA hydratase-related protein [Pseudooceanicola sp.]